MKKFPHFSNIHHFPALIGKRFTTQDFQSGTPEFKAAIEKFSEELGEPVTYEVVNAVPTEEGRLSNFRRNLYNNDKILVISSGGQPITMYRVRSPYDDQLDRYPDGDVTYIMPHYKLTKDFDKTLTSYLLYYLSITAHRYLEIIKSFYATPEGEEPIYNKKILKSYTLEKIKRLLKIDDAFNHENDLQSPLKQQKIHAEYYYESLMHELSNIIIRRAEPFTVVSVDDVIEKAFTCSKPEILQRTMAGELIKGPNDEMELTIRYLILASKLIVYDFNKFNNQDYNPEEFEADKEEFELITTYFMVHSQFAPKKSDGAIIEPTQGQIDELMGVLKEVRGEMSKTSSVLAIDENKIRIEKANGVNTKIVTKRTMEEIHKLREIRGYEMQDNRSVKITRCAYYIDKSNDEIQEIFDNRPEIKKTIQQFVDLAKLKVFTAASRSDFKDICKNLDDKGEELKAQAHMPRYLNGDQQCKADTFIQVIYSMTETKRRQEDSIDKIKNATQNFLGFDI